MKLDAVHRVGQAAAGIWGNHTATIDWCEDNYAVSIYLAEFWNTVSNIPFVCLGLYGIWRTRGLRYRSRYALLQGGIATIGVGSMIFHSTLKWHAQVMLDELPMIFVSTLALYLLTADDEPKSSSSRPFLIKLGLTIVPICVSVAYLAYPDPILHQICYGIIQITSVFRLWFLYRSERLTPAMVEQSKALLNSGTIIFLFGFIVWNFDNIFCDNITFWRRNVSEYLGWISQGHAMWHILTGIGGSRIAVGIIYLTLSLRHPGDYELAYSLPYVPHVRPKSRKDLPNGPSPRLGSTGDKKDL